MQTKTRGYICVHIPWLQSTLNLTLGQMDLDALALVNVLVFLQHLVRVCSDGGNVCSSKL